MPQVWKADGVTTDALGSSTSTDALPRGAKLGLTVAVLAMTVLPYTVTGMNLAIPEIQEEFDSSLAALSWTLSGYSIVLASFTMLGGSLSTRFGNRRMFVVGVVFFTLGSLLCIVAPGTVVLIAARVVQALGGALVVPSSVSVALAGWPDHRRVTAMGIWTAAFPIGSSVAPVAAALLLDAGSWRLIFVPPMVAGIVVLVMVPMVPNDRVGGDGLRASTPLPDLGGMALGTVSVALLAVGIVQGRSWGWTSWAILGCLAGAAVLVPLFIVRCRRHARPFLPMHLFSVPTFRVANVTNVLISMIGMSVWLVWPLMLGGLWGYDALHIGLAMTPTPLIGGTVSILVARWCQVHGFRTVLIVGGAALVAAMWWFYSHTTVEPDYWTAMFPGLVLMGIGMGCTFAPLNAAALVDLPRGDLPQGNATFSTGRFLSGAIGIALVVAMLGEPSEEDPLAAFDRAYFLLFVVSVVALIALVVLWPRRATAGRTARLQPAAEGASSP